MSSAQSQPSDRDRESTGSMERVTVRIPSQQLEDVQKRVDSGEFPNRSEAIRAALREFVE